VNKHIFTKRPKIGFIFREIIFIKIKKVTIDLITLFLSYHNWVTSESQTGSLKASKIQYDPIPRGTRLSIPPVFQHGFFRFFLYMK
jgi:hypothetical protein